MLQRITHRDLALHPSFFALIRQVFPRADFARWTDWGEWTSDYCVWAWLEQSQVLATIGVTQMALCMEGVDIRAQQWGAVAVHPEHRGRGLSRLLAEAVIEQARDVPIFLYANPKVRDFYPRFGFEPRASLRFRWPTSRAPAQSQATTIDLRQAAERQRFHLLAESSLPESRRLSAPRSSRITSWYYANDFALPLRALPGDGLICCEVRGTALRIDALFSAAPVDWDDVLPQLIDRPIEAVEFAFYPDSHLTQEQLARLEPRLEPEADLFTRGFATWPTSSLSPMART